MCLVLEKSSQDLKVTESEVVRAIVVWSSLPQADEAEALAWDFQIGEKTGEVISVPGVTMSGRSTACHEDPSFENSRAPTTWDGNLLSHKLVGLPSAP